MHFYFPTKPTRISIDSQIFALCDKDNNFVAQRKKDGWRIQIHKSGSQILIFTRHKKLLFPLVPEVDWNVLCSDLLKHIQADSCIIDGEFMHRRTAQKETLYVWDLFELEGKRARLPYFERKALLSQIVLPCRTLNVLEDYSSNFAKLWHSLDRSLDEGLVIKDLREQLVVNFNKTIKSPRQYKILLDDPRNEYDHDKE
jgi:ATP-dependent DNA ligase